MYLLASFILQNLKQILELIQSYKDKHHFRDQKRPLVLNKAFLVKTIVITFILLLTFSLCKI